MGVYALVAAACPAVLVGCMRGTTAPAGFIGVAAILGPATHAALYWLGVSANPNVTGAAGVTVGLAVALAGRVYAGMRTAGAGAGDKTVRVDERELVTGGVQ